MIISFSGLDGTGKSTHSERTCEFLKEKGVNCVYRHLIKDSLSYFLTHKVVGNLSGKTKERVEKGIRDRNKGLKFKILSFVKKTFLLAEILYFNIRYGFLKKNKKNTVICDRYFYDALVQAEYLGISGRIFSKAYKSLIIKPDMAFFLYAEPRTAYLRKEEFDIGYFDRKNDLYKDMGKKVEFNTIISDWIDSTQDRIEGSIDSHIGGFDA